MLELVVAHGKQGEGRGRALMEAVFAKVSCAAYSSEMSERALQAEALGCDVYSECDNEPNVSFATALIDRAYRLQRGLYTNIWAFK